jgi:hypothetical protein
MSETEKSQDTPVGGLGLSQLHVGVGKQGSKRKQGVVSHFYVQVADGEWPGPSL